MHIKPLPPETLSPEIRYVHDEIARLVGRSQSQVTMLNTEGALLGPFPPMLHYPQFGIPALSFLRTLDTQATLAKTVREVAILTVGGAFGARFELYAHEIMAAAFGLSSTAIATLAAGGHPAGLTEEEHMAHVIASSLVNGHFVPDSTYNQAVKLFGKEGTGELIFLIGGYCLIAMVLNGFDMPAPTPAPQTYVLVHGAWQAPFVWDSVQADLSKSGYKVIVVELPGHGSDTTAPHLLSLDVYRDKVIDAISKTDSNVILVGHSMGGMVITHVAEKIPSKIRKLVYIGAFLPLSGQALTDLAFSDPGSQLGPLLIPSADQLTLDVKRDSLAYLFINDGSETDKQRVLDNYRAEPAIPFAGKVTLTKENFGAVEKVYIKTLQDIVISPGLQDRMIAATGIKTIYEVNTSHSPFLSQSKAVADLLLKIQQ